MEFFKITLITYNYYIMLYYNISKSSLYNAKKQIIRHCSFGIDRRRENLRTHQYSE